MTIRELYAKLEDRFPQDLRASFDLDGLQLCADEVRDIRRIVCALDVTSESVEYALTQKADLLITHHPLFFSPIRTLDTAESYEARCATRLLQAGISHISLHTRFDAGVGGINDTLAKVLGLVDIVPFGTPDEVMGLGRIGTVCACTAREFARHCAKKLSTHVLVTDAQNEIRRVAVVGGAAGDYLELFLDSDADLLVTGELNHHRRIAARQAHKSVVEAGHYGSEILFTEAITAVLKPLLEQAQILPFVDTPHEACISE